MSISVFLIGPPGVGKTTLARAMLGCSPKGELPIGGSVFQPSPSRPFRKWTATKFANAAGLYTGETFDGADTIPATRYADALNWWAKYFAEVRGAISIFDGDRFSIAPAFEFIRARSQVVGVHLTADPRTLDARRKARGSNQNPTWMKGRETKARNFAETIKASGHLLVTLNAGAMDTSFMLGTLRAVPGLAGLPGKVA